MKMCFRHDFTCKEEPVEVSAVMARLLWIHNTCFYTLASADDQYEIMGMS